MNKIAVSVALAAEAARTSQPGPSQIGTVVGLLEIPDSDPELAAADAAIAGLFATHRGTEPTTTMPSR